MIQIRFEKTRQNQRCVKQSDVGGKTVYFVNIVHTHTHTHTNTHINQSHYTALDRPFGFQEVEAPRIQDSQLIRAVSLAALRTDRLYPTRKYSWYSFLLEAEWTPVSAAGRTVSKKFQ